MVEFYFIRHGLVDYGPDFFSYETPDVPLNSEGRKQAAAIKPLVELLPIRTICVSPMIRAQETKNIVAKDLSCPVVTIDELHECSGAVWEQMSALDDPNHPQEVEQIVHDFMNRAVSGMQKALTFPGPVLVVAHGGIHWAFCHLLNVEHPAKRISHCVPVHFSRLNNKWTAKLL